LLPVKSPERLKNALGLQDKFTWEPGCETDWGHAKDYVRMMMILQADEAEDWVIATENNARKRPCTHEFC
jgi:GDP-D-mannose dehydratase